MSRNRFHCWLKMLTVASFVTVTGFDFAAAESPSPPARTLNDLPPNLREQFMPRHPAPYPITKKPGHYTSEDWARAIDSVWGPGLSWSQHKSIWENFWLNVDLHFACFPGLDSSVWQDVWNRYYPEILDTVSRGRLAGLVQSANMSLRELHSWVFDTSVTHTQMDPGVPLLNLWGWGVVDHFGAGLTSLPDSSLLVYKAVNPHPLGLVPGDVVLGYDRRLWKDIFRELVEAELPFTGFGLPSSPKAITEQYLVSAGMNWHLFDTIDVVKYASGDTVHLLTSLLQGQDMSLWATEQLDIPGVALPDYSKGEMVSWGVITGTRIGYIYSLGFLPTSDSARIVDGWLRALDSLRDVHNVSGVILDFRLNLGGSDFSFAKVWDYFFDSSLQVAETVLRGSGHFDLYLETSPRWRNALNIPGAIDAHWDRPLAVLTGPGAGSYGDFVPMFLSMHPMTKVFGKPSDGGFSGCDYLYPVHANWIHQVTTHNAYLSGHPGDYLPRKEFPSVQDFPWVDYQPVWLTPDGVAQGRDDVVEAAKAWIESRDVDADGVVNEHDNCANAFNPAQEDRDANGVGDSCECNVVIIAYTGDVNLSKTITSADIISLVNYVFKSGSAPLPCTASGDVNCSGTITSADIITLVNYVFKSQAPPCDVCTMIPGAWTCP